MKTRTKFNHIDLGGRPRIASRAIAEEFLLNRVDREVQSGPVAVFELLETDVMPRGALAKGTESDESVIVDILKVPCANPLADEGELGTIGEEIVGKISTLVLNLQK